MIAAFSLFQFKEFEEMFTIPLRGGPATVSIDGCIATARVTHKVGDPDASCTPFEITFDLTDPAQGYVVVRGTPPKGVQDSDIHEVIAAVRAAS